MTIKKPTPLTAPRPSVSKPATPAAKPAPPARQRPPLSQSPTAAASRQVFGVDELSRGRGQRLRAASVDRLGAQAPATRTITGSADTIAAKTERRGGGELDITPGSVSATVNGGFSTTVKNAKGLGVSFSVDAEASVVANQTSKDGVTTFSVETEASITVKGGVKTPKAGVTLAHSEGISATYSVSMSDADAKKHDPKTVNPFDPSSMPTGTVITFDGAHNSSNEFKATFKNLSVQTKVTNSTGVSVAIEKTGPNTVRVTAGPTEAVNGYRGFGVDFGVASASLGRNDQVASATLKTAEFDVSTPEGEAAYNRFLTTGELPTQNSRGVSGVATIEKLDASSQAVIGGNIGPFDFSFDGVRNEASRVVVTNADGTKTVTGEAQTGDNPAFGLSQTFDANGKEILSERRYTFTLDTEHGSGDLINTVLAGSAGQQGPVKDGQTVTLTFTESQMKALLAQNQAAYAAHPSMEFGSPINQDGVGDRPPVTTLDFALNLTSSAFGSEYGFAQYLFNVSGAADGNLRDRKGQRMDFSVTVT